MPRLQTETFGPGDQSWLGSTHGIYNCRSGVIDPTTFDAEDDYPNGYLPSGTRLALVGEAFVLYDADASDGTEVLAGFLYTDQKVVGDELINAPVLDHGRIRVANLPGAAFEVDGLETTGVFTFITTDGGS